MSSFIDLKSVLVPASVARQGHEFLRHTGIRGREGLVLWVGHREDRTFVVTDLIIPKQQGIRSMHGVCVIIQGLALAQLNAELYKRKLQLVAQVHSHPGEAYHSEMDDEYAIATKVGCLSIVVPDFAIRPFSLFECATYRLSPKGQWSQLQTRESIRLINIIE